MKVLLSIIVVSIVISGCQSEEVHSVQYYVNNKSQRTERMETCELQDRADEDANCVNAQKALFQAKSNETKSFWENQLKTQPTPAE